LKKHILEILGAVLVGVALFFLIHFSVQRAVVEGSSMEPSLQNEQVLLVSKLAYKFGEPERGDIIVFPPPHVLNPDKDYIKRIMGLPGETVEIKDGAVYINNTALEEPYITDPANGDFAKITIPANEYFVMGDNRNNSLDSRSGWTVPYDTIVGKAWLSIWPLDSFGLVPNEDLPEFMASIQIFEYGYC